MPEAFDLAGRVKRLAWAAEKHGFGEFEMHGLVKDAFREVHALHLRRLDRHWDEEFDRLRNRNQRPRQYHIQDIGGESMSKPLKEFASGSVRATIWENEHQKNDQRFTTQTVRVERRYKDENGNWQGTNGFRKSDLLSVEVVVRKAFEFLTLREREPRDGNGGGNAEG
ncbi:hypothetical protein AMJ85_09755 [candidate division BRC1 bacterium SM23_51]|nr:MAG: hypothetical protein AMJ85_09755 [candidate division BRC1 bacterium SM23_51]